MKKVTDMLTEESVSILTVNEEGNHRCAYMNSASDRELLIINEPEEIVSQVMEVWGGSPKVEEPTHEEVEQPKDSWDEMAEAIKQGVNEV